MNKIDSNIDLIDRYLDNQLNEKERADFEVQLENDKELELFTKDLRTIRDGIRYSEREKLLADFSILEQKLPDVTISRKRFILTNQYFQIAAAAAILVVFGLFYLSKQNSINSTEIYESYFEPYPNIVHAVERSNENDFSLEQKAYFHYEAGNYKEAVDLFNELTVENEDYYAHFYSAVSLMAMDDFTKAISILEKLNNKNAELELQIKWYLSLAYIKEKQINEAELLLDELARGNNSYSDKAKQVLDSIIN